ncbi:MAG: helix-turn-helix domain-containing protein [Gaiellales bacterium]
MSRTLTPFEEHGREIWERLTPAEREEARLHRSEIRLGMSINALRHGRGMTQAQLAERSGVPQGQISRIEQAAGVNPTQKTLLKLARALDADLCIVPRERAGD